MKTKTLSELINGFNETHGVGTYNYNKVIYINAHTDVTISCPKHGEFNQNPGKHTKGTGCPKCAGRNKTTKDIINEFHEVHKVEDYDYSKVDYTQHNKKVEIICHRHGMFKQLARIHKEGIGCPKCIAHEDILEEFNKTHGVGTYDYSKVDHDTRSSRIKIICPKHGLFERSVSRHAEGSGCLGCLRKTKKIEDIVKEFNQIHGVGTYDYSQLVYTDSETKMSIGCHKHGVFKQDIGSHRRGNGCPTCAGKNKTTEQIIIEFNEIHGVGTYRYDKVVYIRGGDKVKIGCPSHGLFELTPFSHKLGTGCPKCSGSAIKTKDEIIAEFNKVHNIGTYDYSEVVYVNNKTKVVIKCSIHGTFKQLSRSHLAGAGCPKCSGRNLNTEEIIEEFNKIHGVGTYNYSKVIYSGTSNPVNIICSEHGLFKQKPLLHKTGSKCPKCAALKYSKSEMFALFRKVYGSDTYDYSQAVYINGKTKVKIGCKKCSYIFEEFVSNHKDGRGCPKCTGLIFNNESLIAISNKVHGIGTYDYSQVVYVNLKTKIKIGCKKCFYVFEEFVLNHENGKGCPKCAGFIVDTESAIASFNKTHGIGTYDYSQVVYINGKTKVKIGCKKCLHVFEQSISNHKNGTRCPQCTGHHKSLKHIIQDFNEVHGVGTYDYSEVVYINSKSKIKIRCHKHGVFENFSLNHIKGVGCPVCDGRKKTTIMVIEEFQEVHGVEKFDYSNVVFLDHKTKLDIKCNTCFKHFYTLLGNHKSGNGCPYCVGCNKTSEEVVGEFIQVHGVESFDYSKVVYVDSTTKVEIGCDKCSKTFMQTPGNHKNGRGCPYCRNKYTLDEVIYQFNEAHGIEAYNYDEVIYIDGATKVKIHCAKCSADFKQTPESHKSGSGCPNCARGGFNPCIPGILYYFRVEKNGQVAYKIGVTNRTTQKRWASELNNITILYEKHYQLGQDALDAEYLIKKEFKFIRCIGEPLIGIANTELFQVDVLGVDNEYNRKNNH